ncbi:redoxin domain-containing protein [Mycoplasmopsis alligatoris]|uniref:Antioxidant, AhpC/TSA family n=1 Tax=Mycoplasmopsis alligatoris A21JP2 TaxID=747682 RepID=D4XW58_9BACT|nr:redoxin domain-containing protein [Mycoplasmopsis alligatoris]EFF41435.1 antioxidant, AhpC/TSA family [Mycoplasmopsis alligatoris A21JP2]
MKKLLFGEREVTSNGEDIKIGTKLDLTGVLAGSFTESTPEFKNEYTVFTTLPSIDTRVCDLQILRLAEISKEYPEFNYISYSLDLPTALASYMTEHPVGEIKMYSDYLTKRVANETHLLINELQLFNRSVFILDKENKVVYKQINTQIRENIDFEKLTIAMEKISNSKAK